MFCVKGLRGVACYKWEFESPLDGIAFRRSSKASGNNVAFIASQEMLVLKESEADEAKARGVSLYRQNEA